MSLASVKPNSRICEIFKISDEEWLKANFEDLKYGDIFRMYEPDTKFPIEDKRGNHQFVVQSDARKNGDTYLVECIPLIHIEDKDE